MKNTENIVRMSDTESLGERLKLFYNENYSTQREFAEAIGINKSNISRLLKGMSKPKVTTLRKIQKLGVSMNWLISGDGNMYSDVKNDY